MVTVNEAHHNTAGPYTVEASIPMNFFTEGNFKITFAGVTVDLADIEVLDGSAIKEDTTEAVYEGITIDGSFKDWDAVARYNARTLCDWLGRYFRTWLGTECTEIFVFT